MTGAGEEACGGLVMTGIGGEEDARGGLATMGVGGEEGARGGLAPMGVDGLSTVVSAPAGWTNPSASFRSFFRPPMTSFRRASMSAILLYTSCTSSLTSSNSYFVSCRSSSSSSMRASNSSMSFSAM